jgi:hypothetical protein
MNKVLYIAGYGRSGSTVLDVVLGNHADLVSVGEATYLVDEWDSSGRHCACGRPYRECPFWNDLPDAVSLTSDTGAAIRRVEQRSSALSVLFNAVSAETRARYRKFQQRLFGYVSARAGASVVVDSSKSARDAALRFYTLAAVADLDVYVLHLVRNGRATVASCLKGSNWALEGHRAPPALPGLRAAAGWTLANVGTMALARRYVPPDRYLRVRFEELTARPAAVLERIGRFIDIDACALVDRVDQGRPFDVGHNVGGNRLRHKEQIRLRVRASRENSYALDWPHELGFRLIGGGLQRYLAGERTSTP